MIAESGEVHLTNLMVFSMFLAYAINIFPAVSIDE